MKNLSVFVIAALLLASCSNSNTSEAKTMTNAANGKTETVDSVIDNLPEDIDFGGYEFRVFGSAGTSLNVTAAESADIINDLIYKRNNQIKERFNVEITHVPYSRSGCRRGIQHHHPRVL